MGSKGTEVAIMTHKSYEIIQPFNIQKNDMIAIVGAGGKTTLMTYLSTYLYGRKIVGTSTKIYLPEHQRIVLDGPIQFYQEDEIVVTGKKCIEVCLSEPEECRLKLCDINKYALLAEWDYYLYEADGAKGYPLKGWNQAEPVIIEATTKTIGVLDVTVVGKATNEVVFRREELDKITVLKEKIVEQNLMDIVEHKDGLFKHSRGERILFINKVETEEDKNIAVSIGMGANVDKVIAGSVMQECFWEIGG